MVKKALIFGTFDGLHDGHIFFINKAREYADNLYVVIPSDETVLRLKGHKPYYPISDRILSIEKLGVQAVQGDDTDGSWNIIREIKPDMVICGYDQDMLHNELVKVKDELKFELIKIKEDYNGKELHSSFLYKEESI